jgi:hypothetical protein
MGGTGLEPVTPACRDGAGVRTRSRQFAYTAWLCRIIPLSERSNEPERTPNLAILATLNATDEVVIAPSGVSEYKDR